MTPTGRLAYDALTRFNYPVIAVESDPDRFLSAIADGYAVTYGDPSDTRLLRAIDVTKACALVISLPRYEISAEITPYVREHFPQLTRFVAVSSEADRLRHEALGMRAVISRSQPEGLDMAVALAALRRDSRNRYRRMGSRTERGLYARRAPCVWLNRPER